MLMLLLLFNHLLLTPHGTVSGLGRTRLAFLLPFPVLYRVLAHADRPLSVVQLRIEAAGVAHRGPGLVPPPERGLLGVAVGTCGVGTQSGTPINRFPRAFRSVALLPILFSRGWWWQIWTRRVVAVLVDRLVHGMGVRRNALHTEKNVFIKLQDHRKHTHTYTTLALAFSTLYSFNPGTSGIKTPL